MKHSQTNDVPVATAILMVDAAASSPDRSKQELVFEHDEASIAKYYGAPPAPDYRSILRRIKKCFSRSSKPAKYETSVTEYGLRHVQRDNGVFHIPFRAVQSMEVCVRSEHFTIVYVSVNQEEPIHAFVESGVPSFAGCATNGSGREGRYLELCGLRDPYNFETAVKNAKANLATYSEGRPRPVPSTPFADHASAD